MPKAKIEFDPLATVETIEAATKGLVNNYLVETRHVEDKWRIAVDIESPMGSPLMNCTFNLNVSADAAVNVLQAIDASLTRQ